ncbi:MAG: hypothetical protein HY521_12400 [Proteobacteria bacterium]|nr:hypothetical protein [Pseudomonadota bacterium]
MPTLDFAAFLTLLIVSVVVSAILHYGCKYYVSPGPWSFASKVVVGWIGAWLGTPVFGSWWAGVAMGPVFIVPAILGALAILVVAVDLFKMRGGSMT